MRKGLIEVDGQAVFFHSQNQNNQIIVVVGDDSEFVGLNLTRILSHLQLRSKEMNFDVVSYAHNRRNKDFEMFISKIVNRYDKIDLVLTGTSCFKDIEIPNVILTSVVIYSPYTNHPEVNYDRLSTYIDSMCLVIPGEQALPDSFKENDYEISNIDCYDGCTNEIEWIKEASTEILQFVIR